MRLIANGLAMSVIVDSFSHIVPDTWRERVGFSPEIREASERLFAATTQSEVISLLDEWIGEHQPCLFGRIAAKNNQISYCVLDENDLESSEDTLRAKIQGARLDWTRGTSKGEKSGFIIAVISPKITYAEPGPAMGELARRLCSLYLDETIQFDTVYLDQAFLSLPGNEAAWRWFAGVNYFCAQGDKRWWQDHRFPGGMAFSVNSVGHMVKSGILVTAMAQLSKQLEIADSSWEPSKVDSLADALFFAMRTIQQASETQWGKATELLPLPDDSTHLPRCPFTLPKTIADKNYCTYRGYYHTDLTVPFEYFDPRPDRTVDSEPFDLDFTYLFHDSIDNPAYYSMGRGIRIRTDGTAEAKASHEKISRMRGELLGIDSLPRLKAALRTEA